MLRKNPGESFLKSTQTNPGSRNLSSYQHCERKSHVENISVCWDFQTKKLFILWKLFRFFELNIKIFWDGSINVVSRRPPEVSIEKFKNRKACMNTPNKERENFHNMKYCFWKSQHTEMFLTWDFLSQCWYEDEFRPSGFVLNRRAQRENVFTISHSHLCFY